MCSLSDRFWSKVVRGKPNECWLWVAARDRLGYGTFHVGGPRKRNTMRKAHRVAYELTHGAIGDDLKVLHSCDNPQCVNPAHLRAGTQKDNALDREERGRAAKGERHGGALLTLEAVHFIRQSTATQRDLAHRFCVSRQAIGDVRNFRTWN